MSLAQELKDFTSGFTTTYKTFKKSWQEKAYEDEKAEKEEFIKNHKPNVDEQFARRGITRASTSDPGTGGSVAGGGDLPVPSMTDDKDGIRSKFVDTLKAGGLTNPNALAAVQAYGQAESGYNPKRITGSWSDPSERGAPGTSGGILSWRAGRLDNMRRFSAESGEKDPVVAQGKFFLQENPRLTSALQAAKSPEEAHRLMANAWMFAGYNRPGGEYARRLGMTNNYFQYANPQPTVASAPVGKVETAELPPPSSATPIANAAPGRGLPTQTRDDTNTRGPAPSMTTAALEDDDPYALYAANGGLIAHYEEGGLVADEDEDAQADRNQDYYASRGLRTADYQPSRDGGPEDAQLDTSPADPETTGSLNPKDLVQPARARRAMHEGLMFLQDHHQLGRPGVPTPEGRAVQEGFGRNQTAFQPSEVRQIDDTIDPQRQLTGAERNLARMHALYDYYAFKGQPQKAAAMAGGMLAYQRSVVQQMGGLAEDALRKGDMNGAARAIMTGKDHIPDGSDFQVDKVTPQGVHYKVIDENGNLTEDGIATADQMMQAATGMRNGTAWLQAAAAGAKGPTARERQLEAARKGVEAFEGTLEGEEGSTRFIDTLSPESRKKFLALPVSVQNQYNRRHQQAESQRLSQERQQRGLDFREEQARKREEAAAAKAEAKAKDAQSRVAADNEAAGHAEAIASAQQALVEANGGEDQEAIDAAKAAVREAQGNANDFLQTQSAFPDATRRYRSQFSIASTGRRSGGGGGGGADPYSTGDPGAGGTGGGNSAGAREDRTITADGIRERRGINTAEKQGLKEIQDKDVGIGAQGPLTEQGTRAVRGLREGTQPGMIQQGTEGFRGVSHAEEAYRRRMTSREAAGTSFKERLENPELGGSIDKQVETLWGQKDANGRPRPALGGETKIAFRNIAKGLMRGNDIETDEAAGMALAIAQPNVQASFLRDGRVQFTNPNGSPVGNPVYMGRDSIASIDRLRRQVLIQQAAGSRGGTQEVANPTAASPDRTPIDEENDRNNAEQTRIRGIREQVKRAGDEAYQKAEDQRELEGLREQLTKEGYWRPGMNLGTARRTMQQLRERYRPDVEWSGG